MDDTPRLSGQALIDYVMEFPLEPVLKRHAEDWELSLETAREHERELKRYLALCALHPEKKYGMAGPVDELWHDFILFTRLYVEFCQRAKGEYIHHQPVIPGEAGDHATWRADYARFLADYEATFGEAPPAHLWPKLKPEGKGVFCRECAAMPES